MNFLLGASGKIGAAILEVLGDCIPLVRSPKGLKNEVVTDFSQDSLNSILKDAKFVFHFAGSVDILDEKKMRESNVALTQKVVDALPSECKLIYASSIAVYGKKIAPNTDENAPLNPKSAYETTKFEGEKIALTHKKSVIFRIGTVYGPNFPDYFKILSLVEKGKMRLIGKGDNSVPFVHVDDVAQAAKAALSPKAQGIYLIVGDSITQKDAFSLVCSLLGVSPPKSISPTLAFAVARLGAIKYKLLGKKPFLTTEHVAILCYDRSFDCSKAKKELGFKPRSPKQGLGEMVSLYKKTKSS